jgi:toxin ParE1/3/4
MSVPNKRASLSSDAEEDLINILLFTLEQFGEHQAKRYRSSIEEGLGHIGSNPRLGRSRSDLLPGLRVYQVAHHLLFYQELETGVVVLRILHRRMNAKLHFRTRTD